MPGKEKSFLIIPARNEEKTIASVIADALLLMEQKAIDGFLVVENHSEDSTLQIASAACDSVLSFSKEEKPSTSESK